MKLRSSSLAGSVLALLAIVGTAPSAHAADAHLGESTVFLFSTPDIGALKTAMEGSDAGLFLKDPEIRKIGESLEKGIRGLVGPMLDQIAAGSGMEDPAAQKAKMEEFLTFASSYKDALCEDIQGRVAVSIELMMDPAAGMPMPNLVLEFGGTDRLHEMHVQYLDLMIENGGEDIPPKSSFSASGFEFTGLIDEAQGMGLIIGRKGDRFLMGINKAGLEQYVAACEAGTERLGALPFYKKATAAAGTGSLNAFVNMSSLWGMIMMAMSSMPTSEGEPNPVQIIQSMGLTDFQGMASSTSWTPEGASSRSFIALEGRRGMMRLVPSENASLALPPFAPSDVVNATTARLELSQFIAVMRDIIALAPPEKIAEFESGLTQAKEMLGFSVEELLGDLEGTIFAATPSDAPPLNPMAMMMGGGAGLQFSIGMKVKSKDKFITMMDKMSAPEVSNGMMSKAQVAGRDVWSLSAPNPQMPMTFSVGFEGDWLILGSGAGKMEEIYGRVDSGKGLTTNAGYQSLVQRVGGASGMMVAYKDTGKSLAQGADMIRPLLGMVPMFVPDLAAQPELLFFFDPMNIPSSAVLQKYFGPNITRGRIADGGIMIDAWSPSKMTREKAEKEPEETKSGTGL